MAEVFFQVWSVDSHAVVAPPAEIDLQNASELRRILRAAADDHHLVLVDLSETRSCDCAGLGVLLESLHDARVAGQELRLVVGYPAVLETRILVGVTGLFNVYRTVAEALAAEGRHESVACAAARDRRRLVSAGKIRQAKLPFRRRSTASSVLP